MQGSTVWQPPTGTLGQILETTRNRLKGTSAGVAGPGMVAPTGAGRPSFSQSLRRDHITVVAELKRRSPSKGVLNSSIDASAYASKLERAGAAAISVLTEPTYFDGSLRDLEQVAAAVRIPVLKKDFHIEASQLAEAVKSGASAVLLIARALSPETLPALVREARRLALDAVVEVRSEDELDRALDAGADVIGVNSRNLETLEVDDSVPRRLMPRIPSGIVAIWESGVGGVDDVRRAADHGADAVLVGSALSRSVDPASVLESLLGVARAPRRD